MNFLARFIRVQENLETGPYWLRVLIAADEFANVVVYNGRPHETVSQHCGWEHDAVGASWRLRVTYRLLEQFFPGHCANAIKGVDRPWEV